MNSTPHVTLDQALKIAQRFPVFPCAKDKRPMTPNGFKDATQDPETLKKMFPAPMIAIPTGIASGVFVIDIDIAGGKRGADWEADHADQLADTFCVVTRSGGRHYYFTCKDEEDDPGVSNGQVHEGVDIRGSGGYVIVPPTDGYSVFRNVRPEMPSPALFSLIEARQAEWKGQSLEELEKRVLDAENFHEAIRDLIYRWVTQGEPEPRIWRWSYDLMAMSAAADPKHPRYSTWLSRLREIPRLVRGAYEQVGLVITTPAPQTLGGDAEEPEGGGIGFNTLRKESFGEYPWIVENTLGPGLAVLGGAPKLGKSFMALDLAINVANGDSWLEEPTRQGKVVYYALEDSRRRISARIQDKVVDDSAFQFWFDIKGGILPSLEQHTDAKLIVVDTGGRGLKQSGRDADFIKALGPVQQWAVHNDICVLLIWHTRKQRYDDEGKAFDDGFESLLWGTEFFGLLDGAMVLRKETQSTASLRIVGREVEEEKVELRREGPVWVPISAMPSLDRSIMGLFIDGKELSALMIARALGVEIRTIRRHLNKLEKEGKLSVNRRAARGAAMFVKTNQ